MNKRFKGQEKLTKICYYTYTSSLHSIEIYHLRYIMCGQHDFVYQPREHVDCNFGNDKSPQHITSTKCKIAINVKGWKMF